MQSVTFCMVKCYLLQHKVLPFVSPFMACAVRSPFCMQKRVMPLGAESLFRELLYLLDSLVDETHFLAEHPCKKHQSEDETYQHHIDA